MSDIRIKYRVRVPATQGEVIRFGLYSHDPETCAADRLIGCIGTLPLDHVADMELIVPRWAVRVIRRDRRPPWFHRPQAAWFGIELMGKMSSFRLPHQAPEVIDLAAPFWGAGSYPTSILEL